MVTSRFVRQLERNRQFTHLAVIGKRKSDSAREVLRLKSAIRLLHDLAALPLKREISPLDTHKEKEKPRQARENLSGPVPARNAGISGRSW